MGSKAEKVVFRGDDWRVTGHWYKPNQFTATYRGHEMDIELDDDGRYYMLVWSGDGETCCDGWCEDGTKSYESAIEQALRGALLLNPQPRDAGG